MAEIHITGLRHRYDDREEVVRGIDLVIGDGEAHALLGPSGAGKTTLLKLLSGLIAPSDGRITFDGVDVTQRSPRERNIAQVFQFPVLYDNLDVAGNLAFPLRNRGIDESTVRKRVATIAELLELSAVLKVRAAALSPFQKQLVALGRGLVRTDVAAVLLDEPLTAVEAAARWRLRRVLKSVIAELRITMIYVTHDQLEALTFADRVSVLHEGRILQTDAPETLVNAPSHAFVGHFIGSPGMNLLPARVTAGDVRVDGASLAFADDVRDGSVEIGFRPEDVDMGVAEGPDMTIDQVDVLGERRGQRFGVLHGKLGGHRIALRGAITSTPPFATKLSLRRFFLFADGARIHASH